MTVTRFEEVSLRGQKNVRCAGCGKRLRRSTTVTNTVNPYNRNAAGQVKTYGEVRADVERLLAEWRTAPERCGPCADEAKEAERLRRHNALWGLAKDWSTASTRVLEMLAEGFVADSRSGDRFDDEASARAAYGAYVNERAGNTYVVLLRRAAPGAGWDVEEYREVEPRKVSADA